MKCVVINGPRNMVVTEREFPTNPGPDYVPIDVRAVGICGSDIHAYQGSQPLQTYPRILGHEVAGTVSYASGGFEEGQPVTVEPLLRCGQCYPCREGRYNCCVELRVVGIHADGAMCERIWAQRHLVYKLPRGMPIQEGALIEPLAIACQVVDRARIKEGDSVLVLGAGPIGLLTLQAAKARGAQVFVSEVDSGRLQLAEQLGADGTINPGKESLVDRVDEMTIGEGTNVVIEAAGSPAATRQAIEAVSAAGRVVLVGLYGGKIDFEPLVMIRKELDLVGSRNSSGKFPVAIALVDEGKVRVSELITHSFPLGMAPKVFEEIDTKRIRPVKALLLPSTP